MRAWHTKTVTTDAPAVWGEGVHLEWLRRLEDIERLEAEWRTLESAVKDRMVFATFDYVTCWYRHYRGVQGEPLLGVARQNDALVGIAPLFTRRGRVGRIPVRRIDFVGYNAKGGEFLIHDDQPQMVRVLVDSLINAVPFDVACFENTDTNSPKFGNLQQAATDHGLRAHCEDDAYATVNVKDGYEAYCRGMSRNFRRNLKRLEERMAAAGCASVEGVRFWESRGDLAAALKRMFAVDARSWKTRERGRPMGEHHRCFYEDLAERFGRRGMIDLSILTLKGTDIAFMLALVERGFYYDVTISYHADYAPLSPGIYLMQQVLQALPGRGVHTVISHGAHDYKRRWATAFVPISYVYVFSRSLRGRMSRFLKYELARRFIRSIPPS